MSAPRTNGSNGFVWDTPAPAAVVKAATAAALAPAAQWGFTEEKLAESATKYDEKYLEHVFGTIESPFVGAWDVAAVRAARASHEIGQFVASSRLADEFIHDYQIYAAMLQRCAPAVGLEDMVEPGIDTALGRTVAGELHELLADDSRACPFGTRAGAFWEQAMMGAEILQVVWRPRDDGSKIDPMVRTWPKRHAWWNWSANGGRGGYQAATSTDGVVDVVDGDGKWIVLEPYGRHSFLKGALRPLALLYADKGYAFLDRAGFAAAHGSVSVIGSLPHGIKVESDEGRALKKLINDIRTRARSGGVLPFETTAQFLEAQSRTWQIFGEMIKGDDSAVAKAILGQDATTSNSSPGVYTAPIFEGVLWALVDADTRCFAGGISRGLFRPYTLLNYGREDLVGRLKYLLPDPREVARHKSLIDRNAALAATIQGWRAAGLEVTQDDVDALARELNVRAPKLAAKPPAPAPAAAPPPAAPNAAAA